MNDKPVSLPRISIQHAEHAEPTPEAVLKLFRGGHDTLDCARHFAIGEPEARAMLSAALNREYHEKERKRLSQARYRASLAEARAKANRHTPEAYANGRKLDALRKEGLLP